MKKTQTEIYININKAIEKAKSELSGTSISNCNIEMNVQADGATQVLAQALLAQAEANESNSCAMLKLAEALNPINVSAISITNHKLEDFK